MKVIESSVGWKNSSNTVVTVEVPSGNSVIVRRSVESVSLNAAFKSNAIPFVSALKSLIVK